MQRLRCEYYLRTSRDAFFIHRAKAWVRRKRSQPHPPALPYEGSLHVPHEALGDLGQLLRVAPWRKDRGLLRRVGRTATLRRAVLHAQLCVIVWVLTFPDRRDVLEVVGAEAVQGGVRAWSMNCRASLKSASGMFGMGSRFSTSTPVSSRSALP